MRRTFICKPSAQLRQNCVKAATSTEDMLNAFENKLAESVHTG